MQVEQRCDRAGDRSLGRIYSLSIEEMPQAVVDTIKMVALAQQAVVFDSGTLSWDSYSVTQSIKRHYNHSGFEVPKVESCRSPQLGFISSTTMSHLMCVQ